MNKLLHLFSENQKASMWYLFCNLLNKGFPLIIYAIIVRIVTEEEYGYYVNFNTWLAIIQIIVTLYLYSSINRAKYEFDENHNSYISSILVLGSIATIIFLAIYCVFPDGFSALFNIQHRHMYIMLLYLIVQPAFLSYQVRERVEFRYKNYTVITIFMATIPILFALLGVFVAKEKTDGLIFGNIIPMAMISLFIYYMIIKDGRVLYNKSYWGIALLISVPLIPHGLSMIVLSASDKIIIQKLCGAADVARYAVGYTCATALSLITNSLNLAFSPWMYQQLHEGKYDIIREKAYYMMLGLSYVSAFILLLGPELVLVFGGEKYIAASTIIPCVTMGLLVQAAYNPLVITEINAKKTLWVSLATCVAAVLNIVLNLIFIPIWGYQSAAYTTLVGYIVLYLMHYVNCCRLHLGNVIDWKKNLLIFVSMLVFSFFAGCCMKRLVCSDILLLLRF
jgi:O-antigen/teichoic acid export membrane protein